jgi:O-antigen/teichoic acid export membrane protein
LRAARAPVGVVTAMHPLARTGGIAAAQVIVTTAVLMVVYRLVTHAFGLAALGLWGSAAALASLVVIADGGLADLMVRQIAEAAGRLEWARARGLHRALTLSSIAGLAAGALAVVPLVREVLGAAVPAARGAALDGLVTGATLVGCLSPIATAQLGVLEALGRYDLKLWIAAASGGAMMLVAAIASPAAGTVGVAGVFVAGGLVNAALGAWLAERLLRSRAREVERVRGAEVVALLRLALPVRLAGLLTLGLEPVTRLALVRFGGAEVAALYELAYRVIFQLRGVVVAGLQTLVPYLARRGHAPSQAAARIVGHSALCATVLSVPLLSLALAGLPALAFVIVGRPVPHVGIYGALLALGWLVNIVTVPFYFANLAAGRVHRNWVAQAVLCGLNVVFAPLGGWLGADVGVVAGTSAAIALGSLVVLAGWPGAAADLAGRLSATDRYLLLGSAAVAAVVTAAAALGLALPKLLAVDAAAVVVALAVFGWPLARRSIALLRAAEA